MTNQPLPITLDFSDIYSFGELETLKKELTTGGIYIWGFVFEKDAKGEPSGEPLKHEMISKYDGKSHCFIPYYVGKSSGNSSTIYSRLIDHRKKNKKYLILNPSYLKSFFKDPSFPSKMGKGSNAIRKDLIKLHKETKGIAYYNNKSVIMEVFGEDLDLDFKTSTFKKEDYPQDLVLDKVKDSAEKVRIEKLFNDFFKEKQFFTYANIQCNLLNYEWLETYICYRLKGKTISQHRALDFIEPKRNQCKIEVKVHSLEGHITELFKESASEKFDGYQKF